jgi:hypothetical protein
MTAPNREDSRQPSWNQTAGPNSLLATGKSTTSLGASGSVLQAWAEPPVPARPNEHFRECFVGFLVMVIVFLMCKLPLLQCPFCTTPLKENARFCFACENKIPIPSVGTTTSAAGVIAAVAPASASISKVRLGMLFLCIFILTKRASQFRTCLHCQMANPPSLTHCAACDTALPAAAAVTAPTTAATSSAPSDQLVCALGVFSKKIPHKIYHVALAQACHNCGKGNPSASRFCNWCGFKAPLPVQQIVVCQACALENMLGAKFCNDCGTPLPTEALFTAGQQSLFDRSARVNKTIHG